MSQVVITFTIAELICFLVVGIATAGNALEGFGISAIAWAAAWLAIALYTAWNIADSGEVTYAPVIAIVIAAVNFLVFRLAAAIEKEVRTA